MKKIILLFSALLLTAFGWQANAQGDCFSSGTYDYNDNEDFTNAVGFIANTPGDYITLTFTGGITEAGYDYWFINDAADGSGTTIASGDGAITGAYESTTGEISFFVDSDGTWSPVSGGGTAGSTWDTFVYSLSCSPPPSCPDPSAGTASNITTTSADLVWTAGGAETMWDLEYGAAPFTPTGTPTMTGVTNPFNYSGLTANTAYEFYVRADCGGDQSNWVGPYSFTTLCPSSFTPGYLEDFTTWIPGCWDEADNGAPSTGPTGAGAGEWNHSDYLNNGGANDAAKINLWNTGTSDWLLSPNFDMSAGGPWELVINAGVTTYNGTGSIAMGSDDSVQVVISTDGGLTWGAIYTWDVNNSPSNGGSPYVIDLSAYTSTTNLFGIWASEGTVDDAEDFDFHIGSFEIRTPPLCAEPSALTVSNITSSSADLDWTAGGTETMWDLEYGAAPFTPTGTPTVSGVTNPYNYSGLAANTTYEFYVRADCGGTNGTSAWAGPYSFTTYGDCASSGSYDYLDNSTMASSLQSFIANTPGDYITLTFSAGSTEACCDVWFIMDAADGTGNIIATGAGSIFGSYESTTGEISFYVVSDGSVVGVTFEYDLSCSPPPSCPASSALNATNITTTSADLAWTENGTAISWEVEYDSTGFVQGTGSTVVTGTNPHALTGLTANYSYDFYVRAICGVGDSSAWAGPYSFNTPCNTFSVPFVEGFNSASTTQSCWTVLDNDGDVNTWNLDYTTNPFEGDEAAVMYTDFNAGANDDYMITPQINLTGNERLRYSYRVQSASEPNDFEILLSTTTNSPASFTNVLLVDTSSNITYVERIIDLSAYTGNVYIAFHIPAGGLDGWRLYIDDVNVEAIPTCPSPTTLTVSNITTTSADLDWTENGTATSWEVEYDSTGFVQGTGTTVVTGTNPHALTGLTANSSYDFYVRAICGVGDTSAWAGPYSFSTYGDCASSGAYDYSSNEDSTNAIGFVANTPGDYITLTFSAGSTEACCDDWFIMDAADGTGNIIATGAGSILGSYESTTGEISFYVVSDGSVVGVTFEYDLSCAPPCSGLTLDLGADVTLCSGQDSVMLDAGAGPYTYEWSTLETTQTIVVSSSTFDTVEYSVLITDTVSMCQAIDTVNVTFDDCSSISELTGSNVSVYPNPSNGNFIVSLSNISEQISVQVVDMQGRLIYSKIEGLKAGKENVISLDNVERGVYLISVSSDKGRYTQSIVIE